MGKQQELSSKAQHVLSVMRQTYSEGEWFSIGRFYDRTGLVLDKETEQELEQAGEIKLVDVRTFQLQAH